MNQNIYNYPWLEDLVDTPVGKIQKVKTRLGRQDLLGMLKMRMGIGRDNYRVTPGLYAAGSPDDRSPVLVTANYKLTFDELRRQLTSQNVWILVLDTKGINVWCAAGKGTFGTAELTKRIYQVNLHQLVAHRNLILPQLGAPGVAAHHIKKNTGFKVIYGPVRAVDIPLFIENNMQADQRMRRVCFSLPDRLAVVPVELSYSLKLIPALFAFFFIYNLIDPVRSNLVQLLHQTIFNLIPYLAAFALGTIGIAVLLPYLPFRSFALKGALLGGLWAGMAAKYHSFFYFPESNLVMVANSLLLISITAFFSLNFTGSSTYTSLSGVQKETLFSVPLMALAAVTGLIMLVLAKILLFLG